MDGRQPHRLRASLRPVTVAVIGREIGWRWAAFSVTFNTSLAYVVSMVIYQVGSSLQPSLPLRAALLLDGGPPGM